MALNATGTGAPVQKGDYIDYTPSFDVAAGRVVVIGNFVGIAPRPIASGETGVVQVEGVVTLPKASNVTFAHATTIAAGGEVYFATGASGVAMATGAAYVTGVKAGYAVEEAVTGASTVKVKLER